MDIAWIGHAAFRLRGREGAVVTDPCPSSTGFRLNRPQADIVTVSNAAPEHAWVDGVAGKPLHLDAPGEYEVKNILVTGLVTSATPPARRVDSESATAADRPDDDSPADVPGEEADADARAELESGEAAAGSAPPDQPRNVAFIIAIDQIVVAHLGDLRALPPPEVMQELGRADVLLLPVGGHGHLGAELAAKIASELEPRLIIPMLYKVSGETADLDDIAPFLSQSGAEAPGELDNHLNVTRSSLPERPTVHLLAPRGD